MKNEKRIISTIMAILMVFSVCQLGLSAVAVNELETVTTKLKETPVATFSATSVTRVAAAVNSTALGTTIVKATPSGVPYLTGDYSAIAYAGETPSATKITFKAETDGITVKSISCANESVLLTEMKQESDKVYSCEVQGGQAKAGSVLEFIISYKWTDGNTYIQKCYSYVEDIAIGGSYVFTEQMVNVPILTMHRYYATISAFSRILGQGVYYETADTTGTYGDYNPATDTFTESTADGYTVSKHEKYQEKTSGGSLFSKTDVNLNYFAENVSVANIYIDKSVTNTFADRNIRMNLISSNTTTDNTNSQCTYKNFYSYSGIVSSTPSTYANNTEVSGKLGFNTSVGNSYSRNAEITNKFFNGSIENISDGDEFTVINNLYASNTDPSNYRLYNNTYVPMPMVFHIVDKSALRDKINEVLNSSPTSPYVTNINKGKNPQEWYYKSGWANFDSALANANSVLNQPDATQEIIDSATNALGTMYSNLILKTADYSLVDSWYEKADKILENSDCYSQDEIALIEEAVEGVTYNYNVLYQETVDTMARNLETAVKDVVPLPADYAAVDAALAKTEGLEPTYYSNYNLVDDAVKAVVRDLPMTQQSEVNAMAKAVDDAIAALIELDADYTQLNIAISEASSLNRSNYTNYSTINAPLRAAKNAVGYKISQQAALDSITAALKTAISNLILKDATKTALKTALELKLTHADTVHYDEDLLTAWSDLVRGGQTMYDDATLTILDNETIIAKAAEITSAYNAVEASYYYPIDTSKLEKAKSDFTSANESLYTAETWADYKATYDSALLVDLTNQEAIDGAVKALDDAKASLVYKGADYTAFNEAVKAFDDIKNDTVSVAEYDAGTVTFNDINKYDSSAISKIQSYINSCVLNYNIKSQATVDAYTAEIVKLTNELVAKIVTSNLDAAKADYVAANEDFYTAETWANYKTAYEASLLVDLTDQSSINSAVSALANAKTATVLKDADYTAFNEAVKAYDNIKDDVILVVTYNKGVVATEEVGKYDDSAVLAIQLYIDSCNKELTIDLQTTVNGYVSKIESLTNALTEKVVTSNLYAAKTDFSSVTKEYYTDETYSAYKKAYDDSLVVNLKDQTVINNAVTALADAKSALVLKGADYTEFNAAIKAFDNKKDNTVLIVTYNAGVISNESIDKYDSDAISAIQEYIDSCNKNLKIDSQTTVDDYAEEIARLTAALVAKTVTSNLDAAKNDFTEANESLYTAETWSTYKTAYDSALAVDLTNQTAINNAVAALASAKSTLKLFAYIKPDEDKGVVIDESKNFIFGLEEGINDLDDFLKYEGGTLEYTPTKNGFGTGTTVDFVVEGEVVKTYTVVIFGDVNGDGVVDSFDLAILSAISNQERSFEAGSANFLAGDIDGSGDVDLFDSAVIAQAVNGERTISQKG